MHRALVAVVFLSSALPAAAALFKHVDAEGRVTYSDRPNEPGQKPLELPPPNVTTPEARRQLMLARAAWERDAQADIQYRQALAASAWRAPAASPYMSSAYAPRYVPAVYHVVYARTPAQGHPPQGLRSPGVSRQPGRSRR